MLKICPKCKNLSIEYDPHQEVERCLIKQCGFVIRQQCKEEVSPTSFKFSVTMESRVKKMEAGT
jgi:hypothetical protein